MPAGPSSSSIFTSYDVQPTQEILTPLGSPWPRCWRLRAARLLGPWASSWVSVLACWRAGLCAAKAWPEGAVGARKSLRPGTAPAACSRAQEAVPACEDHCLLTPSDSQQLMRLCPGCPQEWPCQCPELGQAWKPDRGVGGSVSCWPLCSGQGVAAGLRAERKEETGEGGHGAAGTLTWALSL